MSETTNPAPNPAPRLFAQSDTGVVADLTAELADLTAEFAAPTTPTTERFFGDLRLTEAEGEAIVTLRAYQKAQSDPQLLDYLTTWDCLRHAVDMYGEGYYTYDDAIQAVGKSHAPAYFAAVVTIAGLFPIFSPGTGDEKLSE